MDERAALAVLAQQLPAAGDDAAIVDDHVLTTDMLHARTDFPSGTTRYTAGWRTVGASLSDVAAMGATARAAVAVYGTPRFEVDDIHSFLDGAMDVCQAVDAEYVGGDLDTHDEFTVATTALGTCSVEGAPVRRSGAAPGEAICVTGTLGRSAAAVRLFEAGENERGNDLFRFSPRISAGLALAPLATAMIDSSDGLARSVHQLAEASECGFALETPLPVDPVVDEVASDSADRRQLAHYFGEDFELVCTVPESGLERAQAATDCSLTRVGTTTPRGVTLDGEPLPDRGYTHGGDNSSDER